MENWVLDDATRGTHLFVIDVSSALVTLVLNLDEIRVDNEPKDFQDIANNLICGNATNQGDSVTCLKICHLLVVSRANNLQILPWLILKLRVNVDLIRNLT